ncbi:potassium channel subfamily U member 1 isoform X2 [Sarcophilus harrisii]|uniref:Potassium channel subfamily U member 1 n=1 Tax=Sarcophilus harrisii TaxID=9305 RepID=A0A7N4P2R1_SARHA|nr:potassium channel subfamily U member 1 isoform X2 [Sarcophilus harrisii]
MTCPIEVQQAFILSSLVTFLSGLVILFIGRLVRIISTKCHCFKGLSISDRIKMKHLKMSQFYGIFRKRIDMLLSAQTFVGRVLMILVFLLSIGSLVIYFINSADPVGSCSGIEDKTLPIDLLFNAFFAFYFGLRFVAADNKIKFWLEMNSLVDMFTIPPTFVSYYLNINWLGLRFLRSLRLLELPQILQYLRAIKTSSSVKFSQLLSIVVSTWFTAAGFLHLVENSGDPWLKGRNSQIMSYFEAFYLVIATTSTVGFGDVVAKTALGRTFIICFIIMSLILFANYAPELMETFAKGKKYSHSYEVVRGRKFIVVCGNITVESVTAFLRNFLQPKAGEMNIEIIFLGETLPSLELETILKLYLAYTSFFYGSALKMEDLKRVAVEYAEACLILANPLCADSYIEDTSNIMRVLSIKNYYPKTRVIIQILQSHNKYYLPKIPNWDWCSGDNVICFAELNLGFIAQGCLVPGLATFLTSLFVEQTKKIIPKQPWQKYFLDGLSNNIVTHVLSNDFEGMSFPEVSRLCFVKLHIMLIAIEYKANATGIRSLMLNPPALIKVNRNTTGFFIAKSVEEVRRAYFYCISCHSDVNSPELIGRCGCGIKKGRQINASTPVLNLRNFPKTRTREKEGYESPKRLSRKSSTLSNFIFRDLTTLESDMKNDLFDNSGMFHWCKSVPLENIILKHIELDAVKFQNHIVVCVFGDSQSPLLGLRNFVMPLRTSNYTFKELKDIVFIGALDYLQREWRFLRHFPKLYILPGSALYPGDLIAANIRECSMCAILSNQSKLSSDQTLVDAESILATLNIGSLRVSSNQSNLDISERCSRHTPYSSFQEKFRRIPIITELKNPSNIHFIEQLSGMHGGLLGTSLHLSTSFSTGAVFSDSFLDSLLATAFYNYRVLELLQMLVTGGLSYEMEPNDEKDCDNFHDSIYSLLIGRGRCKLALLSLNQTMLLELPARDTFGEVFCGSLDNFGILCLGIYRLIDEEIQNPTQRRFVITRPDNDFKLQPTDLLFCAIPFNIAHYSESCTIIKSVSESKSKISSYNIRGSEVLHGKRIEDEEKEQEEMIEEGERRGRRPPKRGIALETGDLEEDEEAQAQAAASYNRHSIVRISMLCKSLFLAMEAEAKKTLPTQPDSKKQQPRRETVIHKSLSLGDQ